jgi:hypothetical protein
LTRFGWQGIAIDVPREWELASFDGDEANGTASLDDGTRMRLRVRWSAGRDRTPRVEAAVARYRRSLAKASRKRVAFETLDVGFLPPSFRRDKTTVPFRWEDDFAAYGMAWHCQTCRRTALVEVTVPSAVEDRKQARKILTSAVCHRDDGRSLWAAYGFAFLAPESYNLVKPDLRPGRLTFPFQGAKKGRWLRVERWGMASQLLRNAPIERWPEEVTAALPGGRPETCEHQPAEVSGCVGLRFSAAPLKRGWPGFLGRAPRTEGLVWYNPDSDKMVAVTAAGHDAALVDEVADSVQCE